MHVSRKTGLPKKQYKSIAAAQKAAYRLGDTQRKLNIYSCPFCKKYHIGHFER